MGERYDIEEAFEADTIVLWGQEYVTKDVTQAMQEKFLKLADVTDEDGVAEMGKLLDLILAPVQNGSESRPPKASTLINRKWKASEVGIGALRNLVQFCFRDYGEEVEQLRPT